MQKVSLVNFKGTQNTHKNAPSLTNIVSDDKETKTSDIDLNNMPNATLNKVMLVSKDENTQECKQQDECQDEQCNDCCDDGECDFCSYGDEQVKKELLP